MHHALHGAVHNLSDNTHTFVRSPASWLSGLWGSDQNIAEELIKTGGNGEVRVMVLKTTVREQQ